LLKLPDEGAYPVPALQPYIIEPIWEQFCAPPPERKEDHPLGCHRPRIPDRVVFEKLVQVLVFGCAYRRIADEERSATTLRRRRDEWIEAGTMEELREVAFAGYDQFIGLRPEDVAVDCCITKAPCGGEKAGRSPVDRGKQGAKRSVAVDADGIPLGTIVAPANRHDSPLLAETLDAATEALGPPSKVDSPLTMDSSSPCAARVRIVRSISSRQPGSIVTTQLSCCSDHSALPCASEIARALRIRWHDLRHTYATLLLARGTHPTYVQKSLGHASVQLTLDRYSHWMPGMGRNTAEGIDVALGS
jgi:transposase